MTSRRWIGSLEGAASAGALVLVAAMFVNSLDAYLTFFGEVPQPTPDQVARYRTYLALSVGAVAATLALCAARRGRGAFAWHLIVGLLVAVSGALFAVPAHDLP